MSSFTDSMPYTGVLTANLLWEQGPDQGSHGPEQEQALMELVDLSGSGLIVDCSQVEGANDRLIELLMRVRDYANTKSKHLAFYNVSRELRNLIGLQNLRLALPAFKSASAAEKLISKLARFQRIG